MLALHAVTNEPCALLISGPEPSITHAASANQNVTSNTPRERHEERPPWWPEAKAQQQGESVVGSHWDLLTKSWSTRPLMTRDVSCNHTKQIAFTWMLESDSGVTIRFTIIIIIIIIIINTCWVPHLEMSPKRFTMATNSIALFTASEQTHALVVWNRNEWQTLHSAFFEYPSK